MERVGVEFAIKALAEHVARFADVTAWDVVGPWPSRQEQAERRGRIKAVSADMVVWRMSLARDPFATRNFRSCLGSYMPSAHFPPMTKSWLWQMLSTEPRMRAECRTARTQARVAGGEGVLTAFPAC